MRQTKRQVFVKLHCSYLFRTSTY